MSENVERLKDFIKSCCKVGDKVDIQTGNVPLGLVQRSHPGFDFISTAQAVRALEKAGFIEAKSYFRFYEVKVLRIPGGAA